MAASPTLFWDPDGRFIPFLVRAAVALGVADGITLGAHILLVGVATGGFDPSPTGSLSQLYLQRALDDLEEKGRASAALAGIHRAVNSVVTPGQRIQHGGRTLTIPHGSQPDDHGGVIGYDDDGMAVMLDYQLDVAPHLKVESRDTKITNGSQVTEDVIRRAMRDAPLKSQQAGGISLPRVQRYVDRLLAGETAPPIKVDGQIIVDGNHRYVAGRIVGQEPPITPWPGGRPEDAVPWESMPIDPVEW